MTDLADVERLAEGDHHLAVVATTRTDGSVQASVVSAGIIADPVDGSPGIGLVVHGGSLKLRLLRRAGRPPWCSRSAANGQPSPDRCAVGRTRRRRRIRTRCTRWSSVPCSAPPEATTRLGRVRQGDGRGPTLRRLPAEPIGSRRTLRHGSPLARRSIFRQTSGSRREEQDRARRDRPSRCRGRCC